MQVYTFTSLSMPSETQPTGMSVEKAQKWVNFIVTYWNMLDRERRRSYLLDLSDLKNPPQITLDDMSDLELYSLRVYQGRLIKHYRQKSNMTIEELAVLLKKQKSYLSLIECGERSLSVIDMYRVMNVLDIPGSEMFKMDMPLLKEIPQKKPKYA